MSNSLSYGGPDFCKPFPKNISELDALWKNYCDSLIEGEFELGVDREFTKNTLAEEIAMWIEALGEDREIVQAVRVDLPWLEIDKSEAK